MSRPLPSTCWALAALASIALAGCATSHGSHSGGSGVHGARPISSKSSGSRSSGGHASHGGHASSGHHGGGADWVGGCLSAFCEASVCALDAAGQSEGREDEVYAEDGSVYIDPPDPILQEVEAAPAPPPQTLNAEPASLSRAAGLDQEQQAADLTEAIAVARYQLQRDDRAAFVARFATDADREALATTPARDLAAELQGSPRAALLSQLNACQAWGFTLEGERAHCLTPEAPMRWRRGSKGWAVEGLAELSHRATAVPPQPPSAPAAPGPTP
jgi:hypothetical protein